MPPAMILVLSLRFSRAKAAAIMAAAMVLALIIGIAISIASRSLNNGLSIFASILGVATIIQGCTLACTTRSRLLS